MSTQVVNYKNYDIKKTNLTCPEKTKGKYFSYLSNQTKPAWIQTPVMTVLTVEDNQISFTIKGSSVFATLLNELDDYLIDYIFEHSVEFFNGKRFSRDKINRSYKRTLQLLGNEEEYTLILQVVDKDKLYLRDKRNVHRLYSDIKPGCEVICIIDIEGAVFRKDTICLQNSVQQMKLYITEALTDWSIENDSDSDDDVADPHEADEQVRSLQEVTESYQDEEAIKSSSRLDKDISLDIVNNSNKEPITAEEKLNDDDQDLF